MKTSKSQSAGFGFTDTLIASDDTVITYGDECSSRDQKRELLRGAGPGDPGADSAVLLKAWKTGGEKGLWQKNLELTLKEREQAGTRYSSAAELADAYARVGDKDKAFEWLEKAYREREGQNIALLKYDPTYKNLRGDPRFISLVKRLGLPE